jgi:hypothetical protein
MDALGEALANGAGCLGSLDVGLDRHRFGIHFQLIKAHTGEIKQYREGYHDFHFIEREQMFFL